MLDQHRMSNIDGSHLISLRDTTSLPLTELLTLNAVAEQLAIIASIIAVQGRRASDHITAGHEVVVRRYQRR
jgi:hypothetical protein